MLAGHGRLSPAVSPARSPTRRSTTCASASPAPASRIKRPASPGPTAPTSAYLQGLVEHWRTRFDWRAQEARLNALPQFTVPLHGIDLHFLHVEGKGPRPFPLLLSHGWPGSVFEFMDDHSAPHRPGPVRRRPGRCLHRGRAFLARLRLVVQAGAAAPRPGSDGRLPLPSS
jgi:hypothetical protein